MHVLFVARMDGGRKATIGATTRAMTGIGTVKPGRGRLTPRRRLTDDCARILPMPVEGRCNRRTAR
jgi:hypothetical protein